MSQDNVDRYRRSLDAWNRGALDDLLDEVGPEWQFVPSGAFPGLASVYHGRDGACALWDAMRGPWDDQGFYFELERVEDLGDTVLALSTIRATGGRSGAEVALKWAHVVTYDGDASVTRKHASWEAPSGTCLVRSRRLTAADCGTKTLAQRLTPHQRREWPQARQRWLISS